MNDMQFEYILLGDAFYRATFRIGDQLLDVTLGDSPDPLEELMAAALTLAQGESPAHPLLWEPEDGGEYLWHLARSADRLHIRVDYDVSSPAGGGAGRPRVVLDAETLVESFCVAVCERATEVIGQYGPDEFERLNFSPFPCDLLAALQRALGRPSSG